MTHAVRTLLEAEAFPGPSIVLCYSPCIEHGYDMQHALTHVWDVFGAIGRYFSTKKQYRFHMHTHTHT
jgi:hypothetical protein